MRKLFSLFSILFLLSIVPIAQAQGNNPLPLSDYPEIAEETGAEEVCMNIEQYAVGTQFNIGTTFSLGFADAVVEPYNDFSQPVEVQSARAAGGVGKELWINFSRIVIEGDLPEAFAFRFGNGSNMTLGINGEEATFRSPVQADQLSLGGARVFIFSDNQQNGIILIVGEVEQLMIAGVEVAIDDLCDRLPQQCLTFEEFTPGERWDIGEEFVTKGLEIGVTDLILPNGVRSSSYSGGPAEIVSTNLARGSGNEIYPNNVNLLFQFEDTVSMVAMRMGYYGGWNNININGDTRRFGLPEDLNYSVIGDVTVFVSHGAYNEAGMMVLVGNIEELSIGGQELWLDDICYCEPGFELPVFDDNSVGDDIILPTPPGG